MAGTYQVARYITTESISWGVRRLGLHCFIEIERTSKHQHSRLINAAAKAVLRPLGCVQKGRSRIWLDGQQERGQIH